MIIYDKETYDIFHLKTNLIDVYYICNIDDNNILVGTNSRLYIC